MKRRWMFALFLALVPLGPTWSAAAATGPVSAKQVFYAHTTVAGGFRYEIDCEMDKAVSEWMNVLSLEDSWAMTAFVHATDRSSNTGHFLAIGDTEVVYEPRAEQTRGSAMWWAESGQVWTSAVPHSIIVAWATWDGALNSCSVRVDGVVVGVTELPGELAVYVGPEAFTGGAYYQDGGQQLAAGRVFAKEMPGGPVFASMALGSRGVGHFASDDPWRFRPVEDCSKTYTNPNIGNNACSFGRPKVHRFVATMSGVETDGGAASQLWLMGLPPPAQGP